MAADADASARALLAPHVTYLETSGEQRVAHAVCPEISCRDRVGALRSRMAKPQRAAAHKRRFPYPASVHGWSVLASVLGYTIDARLDELLAHGPINRDRIK